MATINFAFFFLTLYALLPAYQARQLNGGYLYVRFDRRPPLQAAEVIQMVTGKEEELQSSSYGRDNTKSPPSPQQAPPRGEATYGRVKPKPPPSPRVAPSHGEKTYGGDNPKLAPPSPEATESDQGGKTDYGRPNPETPPSPEMAPPEGETTYGRDNPNYGGDNPNLKTTPFPDPSDPRMQSGYGRVASTEPTRQKPLSQLARW